MNTIPISVGILTFNSAKTLGRALRSVSRCDDIIICDGGSTDDTLAIAESFGARVIAQDAAFQYEDGRLKDYAGVRNQMLAAARHQWFLYIDSDEAASETLIENLTHISEHEGACISYRIPICMWIGERMVEHSSNYPGYQYRVLRTDSGIRFIKPVHERPLFPQEPNASLCTLSGPWHVYLECEYVERYMERNRKFLLIEKERFANLHVLAFLRSLLPRGIKTILGILWRTLRDRVLYGAQACMPLSVEWGRVRYHCALIGILGTIALKNTLRL